MASGLADRPGPGRDRVTLIVDAHSRAAREAGSALRDRYSFVAEAGAEVAVLVGGVTSDGSEVEHLAVNELSLLRASAQSAWLRIAVDGRLEIEQLSGDGVLLATPAGSTAYNRSAGGPIVPLSARLLALTPVAGYRPRGWRGALLDADTSVQIDVSEGAKRPVRAAADHHDIGPVRSVTVTQDESRPLELLFDPDHTLEGRILREQFR